MQNQHTRDLISARKTSSEDVTLVEFLYILFTRMSSEMAVGDSGFCCTCVTSFER